MNLKKLKGTENPKWARSLPAGPGLAVEWPTVESVGEFSSYIVHAQYMKPAKTRH